jgi:hypothetical protein
MWRLYKGGRTIANSPAKWVTTSNTCNLTVETPLEGAKKLEVYNLVLEYRIATGKAIHGKLFYKTTELLNLQVYHNGSEWLTNSAYGYERPFMGIRLNNVSFKNDVKSKMKKKTSEQKVLMSDYQMSRNKGKLDGTLYRLYDPYLYIAYLANYGFPGGWQFTADRVDVNVLTAQSLIYIDKGGVYEGKLGTGEEVYNCYDDYDKIKALSIYDRAQWSRIS